MTLATTHAAGNGKGGGGGGGGGGEDIPQGTIYYLGPIPGLGYGNIMTSMSPDGSNQTPVGSGGWGGTFGTPSLDLHGGHRWFLLTIPLADQYYPDGTRRREIFALRDDRNPESEDIEQMEVQLTDDSTLDPQGPAWLVGDDWVSFIGRRWSSAEPDAVVVECGIYTAPVVFDAEGNVAGLAELPVTPTIPMPLVQGEMQPDVAYYSWDPTGSMIVYTKINDPYGVWVADVLGGESKVSSDWGHMPEWSPDGTRIVYGLSGGFVTIKPNGKSRLWILRKTSTWSFFHAYWSPDSDYLVVTGQSSLDNNHDLFRVNVNNGELVQLTDAPNPAGESVHEWYGGWR